MNFVKRAIRYLTRKKAKTVILFLVLMIMETMILSTVVILRTCEESKAILQEKTKTKIMVEAIDQGKPLSNEDEEKILKLDNVVNINKSIKVRAYPSDFALVSGNSSENEENFQLQISAYDDLEKDGPFAEGRIRLLDGRFPESEDEIIVHSSLAMKNQLQLQDTVNIEAPNGKKIQVIITGFFTAGSGVEDTQSSDMLAVYRIENTIYAKPNLAVTLQNEKEYESFAVYLKNPELLDETEQKLITILGEKAELTKADTLFQQMKYPLEQVIRVVRLMLMLTIGTAIIILTLLLCMWIRSRKKEIAVYVSLGESKFSVLFQILLENILVFWVSTGTAFGVGMFLPQILRDLLLSMQTLAATSSAQIGICAEDVGWLLTVGGGVLMVAVGISLIPVIIAKPKNIFSEMEE